MASGATCVQRLDGSRDSAIHTKYRISLRSSSMQEPRYPLPRVVQLQEKIADANTARGRAGTRSLCSIFPWRVLRRGSLFDERDEHVARRFRAHPLARGKNGRRGSWATTPASFPQSRDEFAGFLLGRFSTMILPQVHLRKPCYDFSFL